MEDIDPDDPSPASAVPAAPSIESAPSLQRGESAPAAAIEEVDLVDEEKESAPKRQKSLMDFQFTRSGSTSASQPSWGHARDVTCHVCGKKLAHGGALYQHVKQKHPKSHDLPKEGKNESIDVSVPLSQLEYISHISSFYHS